MDFVSRHIGSRIREQIGKEGSVIVLAGARQTGKTTFCVSELPKILRLDYTCISFDDSDERQRFHRSAVSILESLDRPLAILDEVQKMPEVLEPLKDVVDRQRRTGGRRTLFALAASSQLPLMPNIHETFAGGCSLFSLYPFSFAEAAGIDGEPLLSKIWHTRGMPASAAGDLDLLPPADARGICRTRDLHQAWGGYPPVWGIPDAAGRMQWLKDYRKTYIERGVSDAGQVADLDTFSRVQKLLCARTSSILSISELARDTGLAVNTVKRYINLLAMTFQCFLLPPYFEDIGKRFVKSPKVFFPDAGLNRAILGEVAIGAAQSYESWVFSELLKWKQLQPLEPDLYFYRTSGGMEIDFLIAAGDRILPIVARPQERVFAADGRRLEAFLKSHGESSPVGLIVYPGREISEVRKNVWAVPDWYLFACVNTGR
jgi:predicted AAA+ superfamily ATPase